MSSDYYNTLFNVGDRLIIELKSSDIFEGIYIDGGKDHIVLSEVVQHNSNNKLGGFYEFYRNEIAKIHRLKVPASKENTPKNVKPENDHKPDCKTIKVSEEEYFRLKDMSRNFIYLENADKRYFDAVKVLGESETIGVVCLGMEKHRSGSFVQLLVMSTWKQVYIFDLMHLDNRKFYPELKDIFESEYVCKVIHKSAGLVDVLYRDYKVYVQNTFDTQIVDLMLQKRLNAVCPSVERDLSECLVHYLNFPSSLLQHAVNTSNKKWNERPLSDKTKLYAAQLVTYIILLKDHFQKLLLKDVYDSINRVQDHVYDMDDFQFLNYNSKKEVPKEVQELIGPLEGLNVNGAVRKKK